MIGKKKDRGGGGAKKISLFSLPHPPPSHVAVKHGGGSKNGGREVVTLTRPNKTPALQARERGGGCMGRLL